MKTSKIVCISLLVCLTFLVAACGGSPKPANAPVAVEKFSFRAAHYFKGDHPWNKGLEFFANKVKEDSKGRIEIKISNSGVLGSEADMMQNLREGTLDFAVTDPSAGSTFSKELDFFALPFMFKSYEHWQKSLDGEPGKKYAKIVEEEPVRIQTEMTQIAASNGNSDDELKDTKNWITILVSVLFVIWALYGKSPNINIVSCCLPGLVLNELLL